MTKNNNIKKKNRKQITEYRIRNNLCIYCENKIKKRNQIICEDCSKLTYKKLEKQFYKDVDSLQKRCPHKRSRWYEKHWAIGHSCGYYVKICLRCKKELEESPTKEERIKNISEHFETNISKQTK